MAGSRLPASDAADAWLAPLDKPRPSLRRRWNQLFVRLKRIVGPVLSARKRRIAVLAVLCWALLTFDSFALSWVWWMVTGGPAAADEQLSQGCPARDYSLPLVVVVPLIAAQADRVEWTLSRWGDARYAPCEEGSAMARNRSVTLGFFFDRRLSDRATAAAVRRVRKAVATGAGAAAVARCFKDVQFVSAGLSAAGTRNSYALDAVRNLVHTGGSNRQFEAAFQAFGGARFRHMLYMEPDTWPIRRGWLQQADEESRWGSFWMRGTTMRYAPRFNVGVEPFRSRYQRHLNGNAIYALDDACFARFRELVRRAYGDAAFDVAMALFRLDVRRVMTFQAVAFRFQATELVVDIGVTRWSEQQLLDRFPRTLLVHGKYMHVKHPRLNFMQYR